MADWRSSIKEALTGFRGEIRFSEPLALHTTFRIGGPADTFLTAETLADIPLVFKVAKELSRPCFVLGGGSNLLVADEGWPGIVLTLGLNFQFIKRDETRVEVGGAVRLPVLLDWCLKNSLTGLEFLTGIPAQFGGAVRSNAGAFGSSIGESVEKVFGFFADGTPATLNRTELGFGYHTSKLPQGFIITSGILELRQDERSAIEKRVEQVREHRQKTQPSLPSAGCIFRNPPGEYAGQLIDKVGLKGKRVGDAKVSCQHANFIVNQGNARFSDVIELINEIKQKVEHETGFKLEEEIIILQGGKC